MSNDQQIARNHNPKRGTNLRTKYVCLSPATPRYHRLMELAQEYNCSYHRIALDAIDWYLRTQTPKKV